MMVVTKEDDSSTVEIALAAESDLGSGRYVLSLFCLGRLLCLDDDLMMIPDQMNAWQVD
jgi:hypothetical protein